MNRVLVRYLIVGVMFVAAAVRCDGVELEPANPPCPHVGNPAAVTFDCKEATP